MVNRKHRAPLSATLLVAIFSALSCQSRDAATAPTGLVPPLPKDSLPKLLVTYPTGGVMTSGTTEKITITATNMRAASCLVTGPVWLGLAPSANPNASWTLTPTASGRADLTVLCTDGRGFPVTNNTALLIYNKPAVIPDISGILPVGVGDSVDVEYDSTDTKSVDVSCKNCGTNARLVRIETNKVRFYAVQLATDTLHRSICFTVHGFDGRFSDQQCVAVVIMSAQAALLSVPQAIRNSEVVSFHSMPVATYDNTGESTHPDFMRISSAWSANLCWMAYTPYAGSNGNVENPSLATSTDCEHWKPAAGVKAPLVEKPLNGYNSDPELLYDEKRGCLGVVYRQVYTTNSVLITKTCDGATFTAPNVLVTAPNHSAVSPTVTAGADGADKIWYVDAGPQGCTSQTNSVKMRTATQVGVALDSLHFGSQIATDLAQPGYVIWHIKVRYIPAKKEYWAMYAAFPLTTGIGNCSLDDLFLATSKDGVHWTTFNAPILNHLDKRFNFVTLYRASFQYNASTDQIKTIVGGLEKTWSEYAVVQNYSSLIGALNLSNVAPQSALVALPSLVRRQSRALAKIVVEDKP